MMEDEDEEEVYPKLAPKMSIYSYGAIVEGSVLGRLVNKPKRTAFVGSK